MKWIRVSKSSRCPICGKDDWCTYSELGNCCMRVFSTHQLANGGYLHKTDKPVLAYLKPVEQPRPSINAEALMEEYSRNTQPEWVDDLAKELGVDPIGLVYLGVAWSAQHKAWAFPMSDETGRVCGIRLRTPDGRKFAVTGSREGIFLPCCKPLPLVYVCEGPTDTAAALTIGCYAMGRPSCASGVAPLLAALKRAHASRVVIVSDNDDPGLRGSEMLMGHIRQPCCRIVLPCKDMRQFVQSGGSSATLDSILKSMIWKTRQPNGHLIDPRRVTEVCRRPISV